MNFPKQLRDAAMAEYRPEMRRLLRQFADEIEQAVFELVDDITAENMTALNALWAQAAKVLKAAQQPPEPVPPISAEMKLAA